MESDMHYYAVYTLARAAGIKPDTARTIAYASQFTDDAIDGEHVEVGNGTAMLPTVSSHHALNLQNALPADQWNVWIPFHFLPGNDGTTFEEKLVCRKDSDLAKAVLKHALKEKKEEFGPHLMGIVAHVYADSYSHDGFVGIHSSLNKVKQDTIKIHGQTPSLPPDLKSWITYYAKEKDKILNYLGRSFDELKAKVGGTVAEAVSIGHSTVYTLPDLPPVHWEFEYENGGRPKVERDNAKLFLEACQKLYEFFGEFLKKNASAGNPKQAMAWGNLHSKIQDILQLEGDKEKRIAKWRTAIKEWFPEFADHLQYSEGEWRANNIAQEGDQNKKAQRVRNACLFREAACIHRNYVLQELLPAEGILLGSNNLQP